VIRHEEQALVTNRRAPAGSAPRADGSGVSGHDQARLAVVDQAVDHSRGEDAPEERRRVLLAAGASRGVEAGLPGWRGVLRAADRKDSKPVWWCTCRPIHPDRQAARDCALVELDRRQRRQPEPALAVEDVARRRLASFQERDRLGESLTRDDLVLGDPTVEGGC
jgi:hypothetical protein